MSSALSEEKQIAKGRAQVMAFSEKLFSLANSNENIRQLWYEHGRQARQANPASDKKRMLSMIVKAFWKATKNDIELFQEIWSHKAKHTSKSTHNLIVSPSCALNVQPSCVLTTQLSGSGDLGLVRAPSSSTPLIDRRDSALLSSGNLPVPEATQQSNKRGREFESSHGPSEIERGNSSSKLAIAKLSTDMKDVRNSLPVSSRDLSSAKDVAKPLGSAQAVAQPQQPKRSDRCPPQAALRSQRRKTKKTLPDAA